MSDSLWQALSGVVGPWAFVGLLIAMVVQIGPGGIFIPGFWRKHFELLIAGFGTVLFGWGPLFVDFHNTECRAPTTTTNTWPVPLACNPQLYQSVHLHSASRYALTAAVVRN